MSEKSTLFFQKLTSQPILPKETRERLISNQEAVIQ